MVVVFSACASPPASRPSDIDDASATVVVASVDAAVATVPADAAPPELAIVDWPITWTDERTRLMLDYRRAHSDRDATDLTIDPKVIVLHYTAGNSAKGTKRYFDRTTLERARARLREGGTVNVSAHFLVDRDGTIYRLQPETRMGRHCIGLNHLAIGVENVGDEKRWKLTDAQIAANAALVRDLAARFSIEYVIGHHEAALLEGTSHFVELDPTYNNDKPDPGARFMSAVRQRLEGPLRDPPSR